MPNAGESLPADQAGSSEVMIRLTTDLPDESLHVPDSHLAAPSSLDRYALSELVNKLLGREKPIPFDFLVEVGHTHDESKAPEKPSTDSSDVFLRSTLAELRAEHNLSSEKVLEVKYVLALPPLDLDKEQTQSTDEWVSCVRCVRDRVLVSDFSGVLKVYSSESLEQVCENKVGTSITTFAVVPEDEEDESAAASESCKVVLGDQDGSVRFGEVDLKSGKFSLLSESEQQLGVGPASFQQGVEAIAISNKGQLVATGGWDFQTVKIWVVEDCFRATHDDGTTPPKSSKKRSKADCEKAAQQVFARPDFSLKLRGKSHGCTTALNFLSEIHLAVGCQDAGLYVFDLASAKPVLQATVGKSVCRMDYHADRKLLAIAHEDGRISFWDCKLPGGIGSTCSASPRTGEQAGEQDHPAAGVLALSDRYPVLARAHEGMISALEWQRNGPSEKQQSFRLVTSGLSDSSLRVSDPRSKLALACVKIAMAGSKNTPVKITAVACGGGAGLSLYSGASDGRVRKHVTGDLVAGREEEGGAMDVVNE